MAPFSVALWFRNHGSVKNVYTSPYPMMMHHFSVSCGRNSKLYSVFLVMIFIKIMTDRNQYYF